MCGIVGYLGKRDGIPIMIESLRTLEYRGYDSAGVAFLDPENAFHVYKAAGKLLNLEQLLEQTLNPRITAGNGSGLHIGIGHIRWATHGPANDVNAHPHMGDQREIALVHNGIIENYFEIKQELMAKGRQFVSETDTECVVQLLEQLSREMPCETPDQFRAIIRTALQKLEGAYALSIIHKRFPSRLFAVRHHAPLVVGEAVVSDERGEREYIIASDAVAIAPHTQRILFLRDQEIVDVGPDGIHLCDLTGASLTPALETLNMGPLQIDKKGFKHFMLKEIHEQPDVVRNSLSGRLIDSHLPIRLLPSETDASEASLRLSRLLQRVNRLVIVGCGTSYNAGLVGKYFIEDLVRISVEVESAGEYRYRNPIVDENTLLVAISQSGETADTLQATRQAARLGASVLTITNREDSTLGRESDLVIPVRAGVEVSVCATKSFTAQIVALYLLGMALAESRQTASAERLMALKTALLRIPAQIESALSAPEPVQALARHFCAARNALFIARGINFPVALEGALKLKEISYIHAEGYSASELKHGPIAMLDDSLPVFAVLTPGPLLEKMISNCQEAKARDAHVVAFASAALDSEKAAQTFESIVALPSTDELLSPLIMTVPLQLLAYYMAEYLGKDVDQPRNLAKSVTVE